MGRLWHIAQRYMDDAVGHVSERELAARLGYKSSSTFDAWKNPKKPPAAEGLARLARLTGVPYRDVLDAALADSGYLPAPEVDLPGPRILYRRRSDAPHLLAVATGDDADEAVAAAADAQAAAAKVKQREAIREMRGKPGSRKGKPE